MWTRKIANENVAEILEKIYHIQIVNIILSKHVIYKKTRNEAQKLQQIFQFNVDLHYEILCKNGKYFSLLRFIVTFYSLQ